MSTSPSGDPSSAILPASRRAEVAAVVAKSGELSVAALATRFGVSQDTIRRDLDELHESGAVIRTYGGAMSPERMPKVEPGFDIRTRLNSQEKDSIGALAAGLVHERTSLFMNSGTTALAVARNFRPGLGLRIITNSLLLPSTVNPEAISEIYVVGGLVRLHAQGTTGPVTSGLGVENGEQFDPHSDLAIIGVSGVSSDRGFLTTNVQEAKLAREMIDRSETVIVVADASKFGQTAFAHIAGLESADILVTDAAPPADLQKALTSAGVRVVRPDDQ